ncbi:venom carboxylesterase-6-like [Aricia agestis]|uniref:venom carboxylesterase-6-like n=1 Tax=Aricia agestis TaxID=91739 RepID=UPI001C2037CF|nr:venom carboxylesterase-6-like [Aricia agestis]
MRALAVLCVALAVSAAKSLEHNWLSGQDVDQPTTVTPSGEVRGSYDLTRRGRRFESYRGIRYAEPPVGELRFQPPKMIHQYTKPVDASKEGPACPMPASARFFPNLDEDCLTINVFTPLKQERSKLLPVILFMHPGGFYAFSGRSEFAGPHYLLDRDLVFVTINYRLGSLGFLSTADELAPGNNGFKDQVAALRWVQRNIAAFGGDPHSVTIAGCSAGSASVMLHMISPMSKGLFHRAISMSGSPVRKVPTPNNLHGIAVKQAELLNCSTTSSREIIDCLKTKPWRDIAYSVNGFAEIGSDPITIWQHVVENDFGQERFLPIEPMDAIREGKMHAVPHLISQTQDEFFWFAYNPLRNESLRKQMNEEWERVAPISFVLPRNNASEATRVLRREYLQDKPLVNDADTARRLGQLYADAITGFPVHRMANLMCRHSPHPVWYYEFSYIGNHSHYEDPDTKKPVVSGERDGCAASRMWRSACSSLAAPNSEEAWQQVVGASPADSLWHSLRNCVSYQAGIWQNLLTKGITDVEHPAAFKLAIVLRHTPSELTIRLLTDLLHVHPQSQELISYILSLLTDDEAWCGGCGSRGGGAGLRDLQLFGDCELAVLAASREEYDAHAKLVRAEYTGMARQHYVELRVKVLNQFSQIPKIYHTPEFECFESAARENIEREIATLREHLLMVP